MDRGQKDSINRRDSIEAVFILLAFIGFIGLAAFLGVCC